MSAIRNKAAAKKDAVRVALRTESVAPLVAEPESPRDIAVAAAPSRDAVGAWAPSRDGAASAQVIDEPPVEPLANGRAPPQPSEAAPRPDGPIAAPETPDLSESSACTCVVARYAEEPEPDTGAADANSEATFYVGPVSPAEKQSLEKAPDPTPFDSTDKLAGLNPGLFINIDGDNLDDLMGYLNRDGDHWGEGGGTGVSLTFSFPQSLDDLPDVLAEAYALPEDADLENDIDGSLEIFRAFDASRQAYAEAAMQLWADVADVTFTEVAPGEAANIFFMGRGFDNGAAGYSSGVKPENGSVIRMNSQPNDDGVRTTWDTMDPGMRGFDVLVHEIGHSLGLDHPGQYDVGSYDGYEHDAAYVQDSDMYSIMSYAGGGNTGLITNGLAAYVNTPRTHDVWVVQNLYGASWSTRTGDTVYGFNPTADVEDTVFDFGDLALYNELASLVTGDLYRPRGPVLTIYDSDGVDTLDLSGDANAVLLDLTPGAFSSTHGMVNNISLAYPPKSVPEGRDAFIENAIGGTGDDTLIGNAADNVLNGGLGDDLLMGGFGLDVFYGGAGSDTVSYAYSSGDWTLDISGAFGAAQASGDIESLFSIENLIGARGDDSILGGGGANRLEGGDGRDTIRGGDGDDTLLGQSGRDWLRGDDGDDLLMGDGAPFEFQPGDQWPTANDTPAAGDDDIRGGNGDDTIYGDGGDDRLFGDAGADWIFAGDGDDLVSGGVGEDLLDGGDGNDTLDFGYSSADWVVSFGAGLALHEDGGTDGISGFENVVMGGGDDTIWGDGLVNLIDGGAGHDELNGAAGDDILLGGGGGDLLRGGTGSDFINGGSGIDTATFDDAGLGVWVDLDLALAIDADGVDTDQIHGVERLVGSSFGDILAADAGDNRLSGGGGDDALFGRAGDDWLRGEEGDDILEGGDGDNIVQGGAGRDAASYAFAAGGVIVNLSLAGQQQNTFGAGRDFLTGIEDVIGSTHGDLLTGDDGDNRLTGGHGNDILRGGLGGDFLNGGEGEDWAYYVGGAAGGVTVDLTKSGQQFTGGAGYDALSGIEHLRGSVFDDDLRGDAGDNYLVGDAGDDTLIGGAGEDTLEGGAGDDVLYASGGPVEGPGGLIPTPVTPATEPVGDTFAFSAVKNAPVGFAQQTTGLEPIFMQGAAPEASRTAGVVLVGETGSGPDILRFGPGWGDDVVYGFVVGADRLDFSRTSAENVLDFEMVDLGDGVRIVYGDDTVLLADLQRSDLTVETFIL